MTSEILKITACLTMLLDHIGYMENNYILRYIGRIAFPIFAYMIASGYRKTRDPYKYLLRILAFSLITEPVYDFAFYGTFPYEGSNNVLFTLALGLLSVIIFDKQRQKPVTAFFALIPLGLCSYIGETLHLDYGMWGVLIVFLFYLVDGTAFTNKLMLGIVTVVFALRFELEYFLDSLLYNSGALEVAPALPTSWHMAQAFAAFAAIFIVLYNHKRFFNIQNKIMRKIYQYSFYSFYPLHLLILGLIYR